MTFGPAVRVLGPVRVRDASGTPVDLPGALPRRLVVALALAGREGRSSGSLAADVWEDREPRNPRAALQMLVSRIRAMAADGALESTATGYRLADSDLLRAEHAGEAEAGAALALWSGEPGADLEPSPLADDLTARADRARRRLLALRGEALLAEGRPEAAVPVLEELAALDPLNGTAVRALMRALAGSGATDAAVGAFARHRAALADALGTDPDPRTVALHTALLRQPPPDRHGGAELVGVRASSTALLGREADVAALLETVPAHRLTSIIGTGGLGKTRLAQEVAGLLAHRFDRIVFTELAGARAEEDVALVVGAAVGARSTQAPLRLSDPLPADLATRTREVLSSARTLLVLDNCEQVVDAAARLVADLLSGVPALTVLTTSRIPLLLAAEQVVLPRTLPAAGAGAALFVQRASAARPGAVLDPEVVERICARLDGLPLAIELAAARLRSMSLTELDGRLADRFAVLVGGDRSAPDRHRTLFAVIDWSRRLLSLPAREALGLLAVFPDGFTAGAAGDVLGGDPTEVLTELVDQSLLGFQDAAPGRPGAGRFRMLETVREFGLRDLAETGRTAEASAALDRWALRFVRSAGPRMLLGREVAATREVAAEEETLLAVVRADPAGREPVVVAVFGVLAEHWLYRSDFEAMIDGLPLLLGGAGAGAGPRSPAEREDALRALTLARMGAGIVRHPSATRLLVLLRRALAAPGDGPAGYWEVVARTLIAETSLAGAAHAVERLQGAEDPAVRATGLAVQAQLLENRGESARSLVVLERADALAVRHGLVWLHVFTRLSAVSLRSQGGEHEEALRSSLALRAEVEALDTGIDLGQLDWLIGTNQVAVGDLDGAAARFAEILSRLASSSGPDAVDTRTIVQAGMAEIATARGDTAAALAAWDEVVGASRAASPPWRVLVLAAALAARTRLGVDEAVLARDRRRLRVLLLVLLRIDPEELDRPVLGGGLLGLSASLRSRDGALADELLALGLALGGRRDLVVLDQVARGAGSAASPLSPEDAMRGAIDVLRSPAARV